MIAVGEHEVKVKRSHRGSALLVVLVFVAVFATLAVGYLSAANANLQGAKLQAVSRRAQVAAESGLVFIRSVLPELDIADTETAADTLQALADGLNSRYQDLLFGGAVATVEGDSVLLPAVILNFPEGQARFQLRLVAQSDNDYQTQSVGGAGQCSKAVAAGFRAERDSTFLARFGVASRSRIKMTGNASIQGANDASEGSVLSTTYSRETAIDMTGNIDISGDVSITNPSGEIRMVGHAEIGGDVMVGVSEPTFPDVDTTIFEPYATNTVGPGTPTSGNQYFENIRILANTNPTFSGNTTIRGVVYVESPNKVRFTGNLDLVGVVVVEQPEEDEELDLDDHYMKFTGNCTTGGVSALPSDPQFDGLRDLTGSFILAPGYEVEFTGNFSTINGSIVASQMKFTGNARGTISGSIINYHDTDFIMTGNSRLTIDHSGLNENPSGIIFPRQMAYVAGSYCE